MPKIAGLRSRPVLSDARRAELVARLRRERETPGDDGPVIFEIPLEGADRIDVIVVWDEFADLAPDERDAVVFEAYADRPADVSLALGDTAESAVRRGLLPYRVRPVRTPADRGPWDLDGALRRLGAIVCRDRLMLALPNKAMARQVKRQLERDHPGVRFAISATASV